MKCDTRSPISRNGWPSTGTIRPRSVRSWPWGVIPTLRFGRRKSKADRIAITDALERVGLSELANRQIGELPGGQQ